MNEIKINTQNSQILTNPSNGSNSHPAPISPAIIQKIQQGTEGVSSLRLTGVAPKDPKIGAKLIPMIQFPVSMNMSEEQKLRKQEEIVKDYSEVVNVAEKKIGEIASQHKDAKEAADLLVDRVIEVVTAYVELTIPKGHVFKNDLQKKAYIDFHVLQLIAEHCAGGNEDTGAVGKGNPLAIKKVVNEGSLREKMTFMYRANEVLLPKIFKDKKIVSEINKKLKTFKLDEQLLDKERGNTNVKDIEKRFYSLSPLVQGFRDRKERIEISKNPEEHATRCTIGQIKNLTMREFKTMIDPNMNIKDEKHFKELKEKFKDRKVTWIPGRNWFKVDPNCDFARSAKEYGDLPILSGPSGTTDRFLHGANYLGFNQTQKEKVMLALMGWMIPAQDHSYHEIRSAGAQYGISYTMGPAAFEEFNTNTGNQLANALADSGYSMPSKLLNSEK